MKDKKQDLNSLQELVKTADSFRNFFANLADELSKVLADIKAPDEEENTWEMKCPYKVGEDYWILFHDGTIDFDCWDNQNLDRERLSQGCLFPTEEAAELEAKRRNLLTRFRAFRDECNGDWKIDLTRSDNKFYISYSDNMLGLCVYSFVSIEGFNLFGCFKNKEDAERAIELFGDEIIELYVNNEV